MEGICTAQNATLIVTILSSVEKDGDKSFASYLSTKDPLLQHIEQEKNMWLPSSVLGSIIGWMDSRSVEGWSRLPESNPTSEAWIMCLLTEHVFLAQTRKNDVKLEQDRSPEQCFAVMGPDTTMLQVCHSSHRLVDYPIKEKKKLNQISASEVSEMWAFSLLVRTKYIQYAPARLNQMYTPQYHRCLISKR